MPTTPSPYKYNRTRYKSVPKRAKGGGGICGIIVFGVLLGAPSAIATPIIAILT